MTSLAVLRATLAGRDPETLIGPLFYLFTRLAVAGDACPCAALADHLTALAAHPDVDPALRLAVGALALEHRSGRYALAMARDDD